MSEMAVTTEGGASILEMLAAPEVEVVSPKRERLCDASTSVNSRCPDPFDNYKSSGDAEVMVFRPTMEEFVDFAGYIKKIEREGAHLKCGICKVIPPPEWNPRPTRRKGDFADVDNYYIQSPIKEKVQGKQGIYTKFNVVYKKRMKVSDFRKLATDAFHMPPKFETPAEMEKYYWRRVLLHEPVYGADTPGSITDAKVKEWNCNKLGTVLDLIETKCGIEIKGVNTAYLYFGMWKTSFPWHVEDMDLYSVNYLHFGADKFWYGVASSEARRFEEYAQTFFPQSSRECQAFLRHKMHMINPALLKKRGIPYGTMVQRAGEFMITFPRGYHAGFNCGYNCAESTNFASDRWIDYGKNAVLCTCQPDAVKIDMTPFMKEFRPTEYESWRKYWYGDEEEQTAVPDASSKKSSKSKRNPVTASADVTAKRRKKNDDTADAMTTAKGDDAFEIEAESDETDVPTTGGLGKWAETLDKLWRWQTPDLEAERQFNTNTAVQTPHCAICQYFSHRDTDATGDVKGDVPATSRRLAPHLCFSRRPPSSSGASLPAASDANDSSSENDADLPVEKGDLAEATEEGGEPECVSTPALLLCDGDEDTLLRCSVCAVCVHAQCYGVDEAAVGAYKETNNWHCERCRDKTAAEIGDILCRLCNLRGGALQVCADEGYCHVICAMYHSSIAFFGDPVTKRPIHIHTEDPNCELELGVTLDNGSWRCGYCETEGGRCVLCDLCLPGDQSVYHVTCGRLAGISYECRDWPVLVGTVCPRHNKVGCVDPLPVIELNELVIIWMNGGAKVRQGRVQALREETLCTVDFDDGSYSSDTFYGDIIQCSCHEGRDVRTKQLIATPELMHKEGARIKVHWPDGNHYTGTLKRIYNATTYTVYISKDHDTVEVTREELYSRSEAVPDCVMEKLKR